MLEVMKKAMMNSNDTSDNDDDVGKLCSKTGK